MIKSILSNSRPTHTVPNRGQLVNSNMVLDTGHDAANNVQVCTMCGETKPNSNFSAVQRRRKSRVCRFCAEPKTIIMSSCEGNGSPLLKSGTCSGMSVDAAKKATRVRVDSSFKRPGARRSSSALPITTLGEMA